MEQVKRLPIIIILVITLFALTGCVGLDLSSEGLVVGDSYRLASGETLNTDLTVIGGNASLEEDSRVNGDVSVLGGNVSIDGLIDGDVSVLGGNVRLENNAVVRGDVSSLGGTVNRSSGAVVEGGDTGSRPFRVPAMRTAPIQVEFDPIVGPLMAFFRALALAALAIVVHLFAAPQMERTGRTAITQPVITGGVGLLTLVVAPALLLLMAVTIILLPLSLLGVLLLGIGGLFGWLSLGLMLGRQLAVLLKQAWTDPINAGVGTLVLSLLSSLLNLIFCIGWTANALIWFIALGAVILTRFGTQPYPSPYAGGPTYGSGLAPRSQTPYTPPPAPNEDYGTPGAQVYGADEPRWTEDRADDRSSGENI